MRTYQWVCINKCDYFNTIGPWSSVRQSDRLFISSFVKYFGHVVAQVKTRAAITLNFVYPACIQFSPFVLLCVRPNLHVMNKEPATRLHQNLSTHDKKSKFLLETDTEFVTHKLL